jgi:hypothetical protein
VPSFLPIDGRRSTRSIISLPARAFQQQGGINACLSCAIATGLESRDPAVPALAAEHHFGVATRGALPRDGVDFHRALDVLATSGIASLRLLRNLPSDPAEVVLDARNIKAGYPGNVTTDGLRRVLSVLPSSLFRSIVIVSQFSREIRSFLQQAVPVVIVFRPNNAYRQMSPSERNPPLDRWDDPSGPPESIAHAACIIGDFPGERVFVAQDSRGIAFGRGGQWLMPYSMADSGVIVRAVALMSAMT